MATTIKGRSYTKGVPRELDVAIIGDSVHLHAHVPRDRASTNPPDGFGATVLISEINACLGKLTPDPDESQNIIHCDDRNVRFWSEDGGKTVGMWFQPHCDMKSGGYDVVVSSEELRRVLPR